MAKIGSARIDENGRATGGKAGDQTGKEVAIENFYFSKKKWLAFNPKSPEHAKAIAQSMIDACNNEYIGYDQGERLGVYSYVSEGVKISEITKPTEADCSALVRAVILEATGVKLANFNTANEAEVLKKSGLFEDPFEVTEEEQLGLGMILVTKTKGHTAIVTDGKFHFELDQAPKPVEKPKVIHKLEDSQARDYNLVGNYVTICNTKMYYGASEDKPVVKELREGAKLVSYGLFTNANGIKWLRVANSGKVGHINIKDIRKEK